MKNKGITQKRHCLWRSTANVAVGVCRFLTAGAPPARPAVISRRLGLLLAAGAFSVHSQAAPPPQWPESLNTAKEAEYMTETEQEVIHELNKVRTNPKAYALYLKEERQYYSGKNISKPGEITVKTREGLVAVNECIAALAKAKPVGVLRPHKGLSEAAAWLAADQAKTGRTGHNGSDGSNLSQRVERHDAGSYITIGENISYGSGEARQIVMQLLIDDGVASRGHRHNILNAAFDCCGVAINTHSVYRYVCVMDFGKFSSK